MTKYKVYYPLENISSNCIYSSYSTNAEPEIRIDDNKPNRNGGTGSQSGIYLKQNVYHPAIYDSERDVMAHKIVDLLNGGNGLVNKKKLLKANKEVKSIKKEVIDVY